jgi:hypothetical protein
MLYYLYGSISKEKIVVSKKREKGLLVVITSI